MDTAEKWQDVFTDMLRNTSVVVLNPRRDDWDSTWKQSTEDAKFVEQVNWEIDAMESSHAIAMYFDPSTKSPITLLELGLLAAIGSERLVVCCPDGFWRKGNVDIVCERYGVTMAIDLEHMRSLILSKLRPLQTHTHHVSE